MNTMQIGNEFGKGLSTGNLNEWKLKKLSDDLKKTKENASDEELMKACKSFEAYMLEQVMTKMEKMAYFDDKEERDNEYVSMFKDQFIKNAAEQMVEHTDLGIAKMLFESMKRNLVSNVKESAKTEN